jgi:hypothetical protein
MYRLPPPPYFPPAAPGPKEIHLGDPAATGAFLQGVAGGYQIFSAGPDGWVCRDNTNGLDVNADNLTNW